jgi:hypothetical protein
MSSLGEVNGAEVLHAHGKPLDLGGLHVALLRQRLSTTLAYGNFLVIEMACLLAQTGKQAECTALDWTAMQRCTHQDLQLMHAAHVLQSRPLAALSLQLGLRSARN